MTSTPDQPYDYKKEYAIQRKDRMQDAIDDYLQDESVDARRIYEEMLSCIDDVIHYHKRHLDRAQGLRSLMQGYRHIPERF